ncbi:MFS transporter [Halorubrum sp. AD140]|uniref:MFS transporter n=1 Tax=Halorubrum sp. AD140 TaxID=3050073 RepID=UPI002ACCEC18|nr:MFS transporter [Halorubrum sp. AD140]MDZ5809944.1 MFS transporter [Halorubrum sp. AD140]
MNANDRALVRFTSLAHALFHTYELSIPLFVGLWMAEFDVSAAVIGTVMSVGYGFIGVGAPVSGVLSDRFSSRRLILSSVVGMGIGFGIVALANGVISLGAAVLLWGCFASIYHPAGLSLISRTADARGTVFAYHGAGGNVGTAFGPLLTALLLMFVDWRLAAGALSAVALLVGLVGTQIEFELGEAEERGETGSVADELRNTVRDSRTLFATTFTVALVAVLLYGTYYRGLLTFLPDVLAESPTLRPFELLDQTVQPAQYVYTALLTVGIGGQYVGGRLTDRVSSTTAFFGFFAVLAGLAAVFPFVRELGTAALVGVCLLLGFFVYGTAPVYQVVIAESSGDAVQGLSYGFTYLAMFGVGALGASLAGFVLTHGTSAALFVVLAGIATLGGAAVLLLMRP